MNKLIFVFIVLSFIFLSSCFKVVETEQSIEDISNKSNITGGVENEALVNAETAIVPEQKTSESKTSEQKYQVIDSSQSNASISSTLPAKKWIKGTTHIIEVVDVTEDSEACIIRVDDVTDLIDVGETKTLNGVKIYVAEARIFNSFSEDKDICELVIT